MYLMYVDESGDTGRKPGSSNLFCLSGIVLHESEWRRFINELIAFRRVLKSVYALPLRDEIHSSVYLNKAVHGIPKHGRLSILRNCLDELSKMNYISITNVVVDKAGKPANYDVFGNAWGTLFQRFENTLQHSNFPGGHKTDFGMVITDATAGKTLMRMMRKMAVYNPIPSMGGQNGSRNIPIVRIIEDPSGRDSSDSYPIQMADVCAYFLKQKYDTSKYLQKKSAGNYFSRLGGALNTKASYKNAEGIVVL